ncbi:hypothetical protein SFUMM280S_01989 [Streptomyces fumanus]
MVFGELYRHGAEWKFRAIGQGFGVVLIGASFWSSVRRNKRLAEAKGGGDNAKAEVSSGV